MSIYLHMGNLIRRFGESVNLTVYPASDQPTQEYPGGPTVDADESDDNAVQLHEPVVPASSKSALGRNVIAGGGSLQGMLTWYSTHDYPTGTEVSIPSQGGRYKVTDKSSWQDYSDITEYLLKGDDQHGIDNE